MKPTKAQRIEMIQGMESKYFDLVWYARSNPDPNDEQWADTPNEIFLEAFKQQKRVEATYPKETEELASESGDFHHGFNSGVLVGLRYALEMMTGSVDTAQDEFPFLDT